MEISTGTPESHETPLPIDVSATPAVQAPGQLFGEGAVQGAVHAALYADQMAAGEAAAEAAMTAGMSAEMDRRAGYHADILPLAASYGDEMNLPTVPEDATAPAADFLYGSGGGDQPGRGD